MESGKLIQEDESKLRYLTRALPETAEEFAVEIVNMVNRSGYAHVGWPISLEDYEAIARRIGTITLRSDVKLDLNRDLIQRQSRTIHRPSIYQPHPLGFHTDPNADIVSWYCLEQDAVDGALLLLDASDVAQHFSAAELATLGKVEIPSPAPDPEREKLPLVPLLSKVTERYHVHYVPWLLGDAYDAETQDALKKFSDYVSLKEKTQLIKVLFKKYDSLFIDNHRMLHGRGAISENSLRHLVRFYFRMAQAAY